MRVQTDSGLGDLVFLCAAAFEIILLVRLAYLALRRERMHATLLAAITLPGAYGAALAISGFLTPERLLPPGGVEVFRRMVRHD